jgi:hypothetical protein
MYHLEALHRSKLIKFIYFKFAQFFYSCSIRLQGMYSQYQITRPVLAISDYKYNIYWIDLLLST